MSDENLHKDALKARKEYKREYMREYMRARRRSPQRYSNPRPQNLHGPVAPANLPRTDSAKALLQAHYAHVLNRWAETGKELATLKETDEMVNTLDSLILENKHLKAEVENLREALKTCQSEHLSPKTPEPPKSQELQPATNLQPSTDLQTPPEPGLVDPNRRPSSADDPPASWML